MLNKWALYSPFYLRNHSNFISGSPTGTTKVSRFTCNMFQHDNPWSILFQNDNPWSILCRLYPLPCKYLGEALHLQKESWGLSVVHGTLWADANKENNKNNVPMNVLVSYSNMLNLHWGKGYLKKVGHFQLGAVPFFIPSLIRRVLTVLLKFACTFCAIKNKCSWRYIWRFPELCPFGWKF